MNPEGLWFRGDFIRGSEADYMAQLYAKTSRQEREIEALAAELDLLRADNAALRYDIARHIAICAQQAGEIALREMESFSVLSENEAQARGIERLRAEFPLFDDEGLDEELHHCEWTLLQDRKRLHAILAALAAKGEGEW